jgi:hypothetical protein
MCTGFYVKYSLLLLLLLLLLSLDFNETWIFSTDFRKVLKYTEIPNFINVGLLGAELFVADRRTDMTKLIVAFAILRGGWGGLKSVYPFLRQGLYCISLEHVNTIFFNTRMQPLYFDECSWNERKLVERKLIAQRKVMVSNLDVSLFHVK